MRFLRSPVYKNNEELISNLQNTPKKLFKNISKIVLLTCWTVFQQTQSDNEAAIETHLFSNCIFKDRYTNRLKFTVWNAADNPRQAMAPAKKAVKTSFSWSWISTVGRKDKICNLYRFLRV